MGRRRAEVAFAELADLDLAAQLIEGVEAANRDTAQQVTRFAETLERNMRTAGPKMLAAHSQLAKQAQEAVVGAYEAARASSRRKSAPYRLDPVREQNRRYAGGMLLDALQSPAFSVGLEDGIMFGNTQLLDARAKQWHRLNFGALPGAGAGHQEFEVRWSNLLVASLGFEGEEPSEPFTLPKGFWLGPGGSEFYPVGEVPPGAMRNVRNRRPLPLAQTRGIRAEHFLDAGLRSIAEHLPGTYENVYREMFQEAVQAGKAIGREAGRPRPRRLRKDVIASAVRAPD